MGLLLPVIAIIGLFSTLYVPIVYELARVWWHDPNYSHGFLIPFIAGHLVWSKKDTLCNAVMYPSTSGVVVLVAGLVLLFAGGAAEIVGGEGGGLFIKGLSLIFTLAGLVLLFLGPIYLKLLFFPLAYLLFMMPLPEGIFALLTFPLQSYTTSITTVALQLLSIPVLREGHLLHLPNITLGIVEACSGIRSLLTMLAGAVALSLLIHKPWWQQLVLITSVVPIAIVTNAFRITSTGMLAHFVDTTVAQNFFHGFSGWGVLILAALLFCTEIFLLTKMLGEGEQKAPI
jgi:exosortase